MKSLKIIYELHLKGFSKLNKEIPKNLRGKYLGLCHRNSINHLKSLNVDAVQIMPVFACKESFWGYDVTSWSKLNPKYGTRKDFKTMVRKLQQAGIRVILDVVYNHTSAPIKGVKYYPWNVTGCENTVDVVNSLPTIMKSIDYWMNIVDGMRFDLAGVMGREGGDFNPEAKFFKLMEKHSNAGKILIAEPYDLGEYSLGRFPSNWLEINTKIRDQIRNQCSYLHTTFDVERSIGFVTCHDGFTLEDLVSYNVKHNLDNGENNRDGSDHNISYNCGVEGHTEDPCILAWRKARKDHMLKSLHNYTGIIMLYSGDEVSNTQHGNNNVWNQDNPLGYVNW
jgi:isoamylase